jgi:hypothetical protein
LDVISYSGAPAADSDTESAAAPVVPTSRGPQLVFVDDSGRRRRRMRLMGRVLVLAAVAYLALLVGTTFSGADIAKAKVTVPDSAPQNYVPVPMSPP